MRRASAALSRALESLSDAIREGRADEARAARDTATPLRDALVDAGFEDTVEPTADAILSSANAFLAAAVERDRVTEKAGDLFAPDAAALARSAWAEAIGASTDGLWARAGGLWRTAESAYASLGAQARDRMRTRAGLVAAAADRFDVTTAASLLSPLLEADPENDDYQRFAERVEALRVLSVARPGGEQLELVYVRFDATDDAAARALFVGRTEVTRAQYAALMGGPTEESDRPMTEVSASQAEAFCAALAREIGSGVARLPTSSEFRRICRLGNIARGSGWHGTNARNRTQPVGTLPADDLGLFDVVGNAAEWLDGDGGNIRWVAGGGVSKPAPTNRCDASEPRAKVLGYADVGFRVVWEPPLVAARPNAAP